MKGGKLVIVSAPSGAGKTTIVRHLLSERGDLEFSISATSRPPRRGEENGIDYYFIGSNEFREKINNNEFLEWEEVYRNTYYGTLKNEVDKITGRGKNVIFDVDVRGGLNIKKHYGERALSIFISIPSVSELEKRLRNRSTETEEKIRMRIAKAVHELEYAPLFDVVIVNDDLDRVCKEAVQIVSDFLD